MPPFTVAPLAQDAASLAAALQLHDAAHQLECRWLGYPALPRLWGCADDIRVTPRVLAVHDAAGQLCALLAAEPRGRGHYDISRLLTAPARLGEGWAGRLLHHLLAEADKVTVMTAAANLAALRCYGKAGFVPTHQAGTRDGLQLQYLAWTRDDSQPVLTLAADGWVREAQQLPSPNHDSYPQPATPLLLIHNISLPPYQYGGDGVARLFSNTLDVDAHPFYREISHLRVSCHFFIRRDGSLLQFVSTRQRAWHAGASQWRGRERCNDFSLGIELEGCDFEPFDQRQYRMLAALVALLERDCGVTAISGHEHVAPGRKTDPGPYFDWRRLAASVGRPLPEL